LCLVKKCCDCFLTHYVITVVCCVFGVEVRLYLIILQCMNKFKEMLEVLEGPLAGQ